MTASAGDLFEDAGLCDPPSDLFDKKEEEVKVKFDVFSMCGECRWFRVTAYSGENVGDCCHYPRKHERRSHDIPCIHGEKKL